MKRAVAFVLRVLGLLLIPSMALAHPMKGVGDFYAGMLHPVTTIETILPLIAISLLTGQQKRETALKVLAVFPAAIVVGTLLVFVRAVPPQVGLVELALTVIFGLLTAVAKQIPVLPVSLAGIFGLIVGWANSAELTPQVSPQRFIAGVFVVGLLVMVYGIGLVRSLKLEWSRIAVRVAGSWLAAIGILVLGLR